MTKQYFYAVRKGLKVGIYNSWAECENQVKGISGSEFKRFSTLDEANQYLENLDFRTTTSSSSIENRNVYVDFQILAYTDGSFDNRINKYSYGAVIVSQDGEVIEKLYGCNSNPKFLSSRNVAGEVFGALAALNWAVSNGYQSLCICHDYIGIEKWITAEWKADSPIASVYKHLFDTRFRDILDVAFKKVKSHSGDKFNGLADALAKDALFGNKVKKSGNSWTSFSSIDDSSIIDINKNLKSELPSLSISEKLTDRCKSWIYIYGEEKVHASLYASNKLVLQGKIRFLFSLICSEVNSILKPVKSINSELEQIYSSFFETNVDTASVANEYNEIISKLPTGYPETIKIMIRAAIICKNSLLKVDMEDYSVCVFNILKALDCHIKHLFSSIDAELGKSGNYSLFIKSSNNSYALNNRFLKKYSNNDDVCQRIVDCYNYYKSQRDSIFHSGSFINGSDETRLLTDKDEVLEIFNNTLKLITS